MRVEVRFMVLKAEVWRAAAVERDTLSMEMLHHSSMAATASSSYHRSTRERSSGAELASSLGERP